MRRDDWRQTRVATAPPRAALQGDQVLIASRRDAFPDELYDLTDDSGERRAIAGTHAMSALLRADAARFWEQTIHPSGDSTIDSRPLDEAARERLRALGYLD